VSVRHNYSLEARRENGRENVALLKSSVRHLIGGGGGEH
jgi:hypothetical protein